MYVVDLLHIVMDMQKKYLFHRLTNKVIETLFYKKLEFLFNFETLFSQFYVFTIYVSKNHHIV